MPKQYAVGLAWTEDRESLVEETDERARFMAYMAGRDVPDEDVAKVDRAVKPLSEKQQQVAADKQRKPATKGGLSIEGRSRRG